jgi:chemotaxis protein CheZ
MPESALPQVESALPAVKAQLESLGAAELALLAELLDLGRIVARARAEVAEISVGEISGTFIPSAQDELSAIVSHTAAATHEILDCCEALEQVVAADAEGSAKLQSAITRIYEACAFQDITGQRIAKVISALAAIEERVSHVTKGYKEAAKPEAPATDGPPSDESLLNGPQLPGLASSQSDIDRMFEAAGG